MRTGQRQKKIDINIPKIDDFIHKMYINVARKVYKNVYLFELNITPLQVQKHNRELEVIVQECILNTVRESIPVEAILKAYLDESVEEDVVEEIREQVIAETKAPAEPTRADVVAAPVTSQQEASSSAVKFNDVDYVKDDSNFVNEVIAPKTDERLREVFQQREFQRNSELTQGGGDDENITISTEPFAFDDIQDLEPSRQGDTIPDLEIDVEEL
jgi:hypothetical protein